MGAVTAFRSCEAAGAPAAAYRQGLQLMRRRSFFKKVSRRRRELLKWAKVGASAEEHAKTMRKRWKTNENHPF